MWYGKEAISAYRSTFRGIESAHDTPRPGHGARVHHDIASRVRQWSVAPSIIGDDDIARDDIERSDRHIEVSG